MTAEDAEGATPAMIDALTLLQQASGHAVDDITSMTGDLSVYRIEERDWAGIIEERAENAESKAAASLEARMQGALEGLPHAGILSTDDLTLDDITPEDLESILEMSACPMLKESSFRNRKDFSGKLKRLRRI